MIWFSILDSNPAKKNPHFHLGQQDEPAQTDLP